MWLLHNFHRPARSQPARVARARSSAVNARLILHIHAYIMSTLLTAIDGGQLPLSALSAASLGAWDASTRIEIAPGSELVQAGSHTGILRDANDDQHKHQIFLKKVTASLVANKSWNDRRRILLYIRNELRFYDEFAGTLRSRGVSIPAVSHMVDENLDGIEQYDEEPPPELLSRCGALVFMEPLADPTRYEQTSPLTPSQAKRLLSAAARLHAAAWEDESLLSRAAERLQRHGGSFALTARNPKELRELPASWDRFVAAFTPAAPPSFFSRPEIAALGSRLQALAPWISSQLSPKPNDRWATLVHGDLKAMNVFLPVEGSDLPPQDVRESDDANATTCKSLPRDEAAVLIDFASTGVGVGMADVAMHLVHALVPSDLDHGGEEALVDGYLAILAEARGAAATASSPYPREMALRHFRLAVCDYGRFIMGRFWGAATPERFSAAAASPNVVLANRNLASALRFIERIHIYLAEFEEEQRAST